MRGLLELVLEVNDLEKSLAFYCGALELAEVEHWPPPRVATGLSIGRNAVLGLWPSASGGEGVAIAAPGWFARPFRNLRRARQPIHVARQTSCGRLQGGGADRIRSWQPVRICLGSGWQCRGASRLDC